jgi:DNA topoisomerase IB
VDDVETLQRIEALAIPPAWRDVWICGDPFGHLQATGIDAANRKQYRYHDKWRERRDREKFDTMLDFASSLPAMRTLIHRQLAVAGMPRERALACAVRLLDLGFFRVGSEDYAERNETYGLATIHKEHARIEEDHVVFDYIAKAGKRRVQLIADPDVLDVVTTLKRRRSGKPELLAYKEGNRWRDVRSDDINQYIKLATGGDFTAKDFRTWNGTVLAAVSLAGKTARAGSVTGRKRAVAEAVKEVAFFLGNTPAVARSSYIDPRVIDRFNSGWTILARLEELGGAEAFTDPEGRVALEDAVRDLIGDAGEDSPALAHVDDRPAGLPRRRGPTKARRKTRAKARSRARAKR